MHANKVTQKITPINADIRNVDSKVLHGRFNHVIMNLPSSANKYLEIAISALTENDGFIHFYCFASAPNPEEEAVKLLKDALSKFNEIKITIQDVRKVKPSAPHEWHIAVTARIQPQKN